MKHVFVLYIDTWLTINSLLHLQVLIFGQILKSLKLWTQLSNTKKHKSKRFQCDIDSNDYHMAVIRIRNGVYVYPVCHGVNVVRAKSIYIIQLFLTVFRFSCFCVNLPHLQLAVSLCTLVDKYGQLVVTRHPVQCTYSSLFVTRNSIQCTASSKS